MDMDPRQPFQEHFFQSNNGLRLYARVYTPNGPDIELPVVCLAGLTRNSRDFQELAVYLSRHPYRPRRVVTIDTRGRGRSERDPDPANYNILAEAQDVIDGCAALGLERAAFIGTSRGGLILHVLVTTKRSLLGAVILNDVGPAVGLEGLKFIQSYLRERSTFANLDEAAEALMVVHSEAFPKLTMDNWKLYAKATFRDRGGRMEPDCDPAIAAATAKMDLSQPLPELWEQFDAFKGIPLMVIRGENSNLLTPDILEKMRRRIPEMSELIVENQGHAPLLHIGRIPDKIHEFLDRA